jgi:hypothetical protein
MEIVILIISYVLFALLLITPLIVIKRFNKLSVKYKFVYYVIACLLIGCCISLILGWWSSVSNTLLLKHYAYNFEAITYAERFKNVTSENLSRVKNLESTRTGIGWLAKVIIGYIIYMPYLLVVYVILFLCRKKIFNSRIKQQAVE